MEKVPPVPQPRRQVIASEASKLAYENVAIDIINKNIDIKDDNLQTNTKMEKIQNNKAFLSPVQNEDYKNVITEMNNLNTDKNKNIANKNISETTKINNLSGSDSRPVPAPRRLVAPQVAEEEIYSNPDDENTLQPETSTAVPTEAKIYNAPRRAPGVPPPTESPRTPNRFRSDSEPFDLHKSKSSSSISSSNSGHSSASQSAKYQNPSPGALLKSLSATSKLLTESISERVTIKTKDAKHKIDKIHKTSRNKLNETQKLATLKLKEVRKSLHKIGDNFSLGRNEKKMTDYDLDRPQTVPTNDEIFQSISFHSPLNTKSNNCENLNTAESSYEIPKKTRSFSSDASIAEQINLSVSPQKGKYSLTDSENSFNNLDDSLVEGIYSNVESPASSPHPSVRSKTIEPSQNNTEKFAKSGESSSSTENIPCPNYPPPINIENVYGKLNQSVYSSSTESDSPVRPPIRHKRKKDYEITQIRPKPHQLLSDISNRATCDSNEFLESDDRLPRVFSRDLSAISTESSSRNISQEIKKSVCEREHRLPVASRSDSWNYYDVNNDDDGGRSSPEPIYANENVTSVCEEPVYGLLCDMESPDGTLLVPQSAARKRRSNKTASAENRPPTDILKEFDPLIVSTIDQIFSTKSNELILLESLLGEETYGHTIADDSANQNSSGEQSEDEDCTDEQVSIPIPPERQDSLQDHSKPSTSGTKTDSTESRKTIIIHQNMSLRSDSLENILDAEDAAVAPYLAQHDDTPPATISAEDLSRPTPSRSQWFVSENQSSPQTGKFHKKQSINPINNKQDARPIDKVSKNIIKRPKDEKPHYDPPSYSEAIGENLMDDKPTGGKTSMKSMLSNVLNKMEGINLNIKRKSSFKNGTGKSGVKVIIEMIPKPPLTQQLTLHEGHLVRLPSGLVDDILKEQQLRKVYMRDRKFQAYFEKDPKIPKENISLEHITTIQCVSNHKFSNNAIEMHCFEITTAIPKCQTPNTNMSNPNMIITSGKSGNLKSQRVCHLYGVPKESERNIWMQKLLESITDVFPTAFSCKYYRAGWCYLKNSISSEWSGAWILLQKQKRKLLFYSYGDMNLECMDLRKARCLVLKENDDSIRNLHVESGSMIMIDCPPFSMYMIMCSPRETKIWRHIIREVAHNNGPSLKEQQLTKDNVPVLVDKCINFIYAQGSMSEGIYRKSGSENSIQKLLTLFRTDAFSVQITRSEYNEHDVANALKRFMRDLPDRFLGKYSASFISVSEMKSKSEKITAYKELLGRLPSIEFHTLKKLIGHLNFIQSQKIRNKMGVDNLAIIWGPTLLQDKQSELHYSQKEADVIIDLIMLYKNLYQLTSSEMAKEQIMLSVLKKYHAAAENLTDSVKKSGDLKVWITIDPNPENETEEKQQINVTLTPTKTAYDICKELAPKMKREPFAITLSEIILSGDLRRPLHYSEKVFDIVLNWSYWPEADRKDNYLQVRPVKFLKEIERALRNLPVISPQKELKFADTKTKSFKSYTLELSDGRIVVMKKEKNSIAKVKEIELKKSTAYIGCEKKRDFSSRWAITIIESESNKNILRTRESPYIGHVISGTNSNDSIVWFSSIWHSLYGDDIMPNPEIVLP